MVTGITLTSLYVTSPESAYESPKYITEVAPLGNMLRGIHYFGALTMVIFVVIHMIRVFLMASYEYPREVNWLTETYLLLLTIGMGFTGQLLRWDQNAIRSVVVGAEQAGRTPFIGTWLVHLILGGDTLGSDTLGNILSIHIFVFPLLLAGVLGFHLYLVIRNGISEKQAADKPVNPETYRATYQKLLKAGGEPFKPVAAWRDIAFSALVVVGVVVLAYSFGSPKVQTPPDPTIIQAQPRPELYFLRYFAVLALLPHQLESYVMILFPLVAVVILITLPLLFKGGERSIRRRPWAPIIVLTLLAALIALTLEGFRSPWSPHFDAKPLTTDIIGALKGRFISEPKSLMKRGVSTAIRYLVTAAYADQT